MVPTQDDKHTTVHLTLVGGRYKLSTRIALTAETTLCQTMHTVSPMKAERFGHRVPMVIGIDIETGGHVFQFSSFKYSVNECALLDGSEPI